MGKCGGSVPDHKTHTMIGQGGGYAQQSLALLNKKPFITMTLNNLICVARDPGLHRLTPTSQSDRSKTYFTLSTNYMHAQPVTHARSFCHAFGRF